MHPPIACLPPDHPLRVEAKGINVSTYRLLTMVNNPSFLLQYYSTISEAIASSPRDRLTKIFVHPGVYNESILIDRPVTLVGAGEKVC